MKKLYMTLLAASVAGAAFASGGSIWAHGGWRDPMQIAGVATFRAEIEQDNLQDHFFVFASEGGHHDYPDTVFKSTMIHHYGTMGKMVMVMGRGLLYNSIPVNYMAHFMDNGPRQMDYLELHLWNSRSGTHLLHFTETLTEGNIVIDHGK